MKKKILIVAALAFAFVLPGCEKDDICEPGTATTPRLVVTFYDITNPTVAKNVTNLGIFGEGMTEALGTFNNVSEVSIPLKTTADMTQYRFILNSTDATVDNEDVLTFNYTRNDVFVSRACGYKTLFNLADPNPIVLSEPAVADGLWIQDIEVNQPAIQNEDETHISIYF